MLLPCQECKGKCCTYPAFSPEEFELVRMLKGVPPGSTIMPMEQVQSYNSNKPFGVVVLHRADGTCPYLVEGKCSIYNLRPKVCKDYGVHKDLPCEYLYPKQAEALQRARLERAGSGNHISGRT